MSLPVGTPGPRGVQLLFLSDSGLGGWCVGQLRESRCEGRQAAGELARNIVSSVGEFFGHFDSFQEFSGRLSFSPAGGCPESLNPKIKNNVCETLKNDIRGHTFWSL